jgi:hypothetical protein
VRSPSSKILGEEAKKMVDETSDIPGYVQQALEEWEQLAFVAYDWYSRLGRHVIGVEKDPENPDGVRLLAVQYDYESGQPDERVAHMLADYDPAWELILQFVDDQGRVRTQRVRTAPNGRYPKRVYFFEMMRRL